MIRFRILTYLLFLGIFITNAQSITQEAALEAAKEFYSTDNLKLHNPGKKSLRPKEEQTDSSSKGNIFIISKTDGPGFVMIGGNAGVPNIIGYSDNVTIDEHSTLPPQLEYYIENYNGNIGESGARKKAALTEAALNEGETKLLATAPWGQGYPFNNNCPEFDGIKSPAGCVPTALGIVMKYHNWPPKGKNSRLYPDYEDSQAKTFEFENFVPKWDLLKDSYEGADLSEEELDAIATLMREIGYGVATGYGPFESTTFGEGLNICMRRYFNFGHETAQSYKENLTDEEWVNKIKLEIDEDRPVIYLASSPIASHCFVVDGYNEEDMIHVNWGWDGIFNGFFYPDFLNPGGTLFESVSMITGIGKPGEDDDKWGDAYAICNQHLLVDAYTYEDVKMPLSKPNISVEEIKTGEPFIYVSPPIIYPPAGNNMFGVAIVDQSNNIKEVVAEAKTHDIPNNYNLNITTDNTYYNCVAHCDISPSDNVRLVRKEYGSNDWELVNDNWDIKAGTSVAGNTPESVKVTWEVEPDHKIRISTYTNFSIEGGQEELNTNYNRLMRGGNYIVYSNTSIHMEGTKAAIFVNEEPVTVITLNNAAFRDNALYKVTPDYEDLTIKVVTLKSDAGESRVINIENKGGLKEYLKEDNCNHVIDLTLAGAGDNGDYSAIRRNIPFLTSLDLSSYHSENNTIPENALNGLADLTRVLLPENTETIEGAAFADNYLSAITIPEGVKSINDRAFSQTDDCLSTVFSKALTPPELGVEVFGHDVSNKTLFVLPGTIEAYRQHPVWSRFGNIVENENPVTETYNVKIDGVNYKLYPSYAAVVNFDENECPEEVESETQITYGNHNYTVTTVEADAFYMNRTIKKLTIPETITELGYRCFSACHALEEVTILGSVKELPLYAFETCISLHTINFPETLESIGQYALSALFSLKELRLPASLKEIQWNGITDMWSLERIILEGDNDNFNFVNGTLYTKDWYYLICHTNGNTDITDVDVHEGVVELFWGPFHGKHIKKITISSSTLSQLPLNLLSISAVNYAFEQLRIPDNISEIRSDCFFLPKHLTIGKSVSSVANQQHGFGDYHIYCLNNVSFNAEDLTIPYDDSWIETDPQRMVNFYFYTSRLTPNVNMDYDKFSDQPYYNEKNADFYHIRVPGGASATSKGWKESQIEEMWKYNLDKEKGILYLTQPINAVEILEVKVNGVKQDPYENPYYKVVFEDPEDLNRMEVEITFKVNDLETFTTVYDAAFNSMLPSSEPDFDYVNSVDMIPAADHLIVIYNLSGQVVFRGEESDMPQLGTGVYIVHTSKGTRKVIVK